MWLRTRPMLRWQSALIEVGADPNSRMVNGATPLYVAAQQGNMNTVKFLLRAELGHSEVVRGMMQEVGIEGCGGASGGVNALLRAVSNQHVDIMAVLHDAGVVDNGGSLVVAAGYGHEACVKFLLQQQD